MAAGDFCELLAALCPSGPIFAKLVLINAGYFGVMVIAKDLSWQYHKSIANLSGRCCQKLAVGIETGTGTAI